MIKETSSKRYIIPFYLMIFMAIGILIGNSFSSTSKYDLKEGNSYTKVKDIIDILDTRYVDNVDASRLFDQTISDMLHKLDPHSNYISAKDIKIANEQIQGEFGGVGVRFTLLRDTICITNVIEKSPSDKVGLKAGDKILKINGKKVAGVKISNEKVMHFLKGKQGTSVKVVLLRVNNLISKLITRDLIAISSISSSYMITPSIGFIKIDQFSITTANEFKAQVAVLKLKGMQKLILDLRNNGGGVLQSAVEIVDEFLEQGKVIVKTKGTHSKEQIYRASKNGMLHNLPLVVLVNSNSASASEIVAGALQDNDRALIIGRRTYGKGLVQEDILLKDGSDIRLTIARYYTPTGRCIQRPYSANYDAYLNDEENRLEHGEQFHVDSTLLVDSLKFKTPKGKIVYGGGGILPDLFIPIDTIGASWYYSELRFSSAFQNFAFDYLDGKRMIYKDLDVFSNSFEISKVVLNQFFEYAERNFHIKKTPLGNPRSKELISVTLKAEIARQLWEEDGFYRILNNYDNEVKKAVSFLKR